MTSRVHTGGSEVRGAPSDFALADHRGHRVGRESRVTSKRRPAGGSRCAGAGRPFSSRCVAAPTSKR